MGILGVSKIMAQALRSLTPHVRDLDCGPWSQFLPGSSAVWPLWAFECVSSSKNKQKYLHIHLMTLLLLCKTHRTAWWLQKWAKASDPFIFSVSGSRPITIVHNSATAIWDLLPLCFGPEGSRLLVWPSFPFSHTHLVSAASRYCVNNWADSWSTSRTQFLCSCSSGQGGNPTSGNGFCWTERIFLKKSRMLPHPL